MSRTNSKKIFCASIESERRARAYGTWDGETLVVTHILPLAGIQWREELFEESRRLAGEGFAVLIEDRTGTFSPYASPFSFDTREQDGTTSFQVSVEWSLALRARGALIVPTELARYLLRTGEGGNVDVAFSDSGRTLYRPDWSRLTGAHRALLMCVYAAVMEPPLSDRWLEAYGKALGAIYAESGATIPGTPGALMRAFTFGVQDRLDAAHERKEEEIKKWK